MADSLPNGAPTGAQDVEMQDEPQQVQLPIENGSEGLQAPAIAPAPLAAAPSPATQPPAAIATPPPATTAAPPLRPSSIPPSAPSRPEKPVAHGGPTRQYLNQNITPHLLEGMKYLAVYEPEKPLLWLSDFLKERSKEVEG
ncbi:hypothetical protein K431DRAFT_298393 [Polychaeton citri CBS 116435]|uniref:Uncharacterized protein n=1 Tax=Polychaeton citri CBS 116435 TaxID=1314669 RepID=A0A9P4Q2A7_9PEZI|nr:hypothetical protein K431DRAFT_298393 [Polychaeton citri CBS 116435]